MMNQMMIKIQSYFLVIIIIAGSKMLTTTIIICIITLSNILAGSQAFQISLEPLPLSPPSISSTTTSSSSSSSPPSSTVPTATLTNSFSDLNSLFDPSALYGGVFKIANAVTTSTSTTSTNTVNNSGSQSDQQSLSIVSSSPNGGQPQASASTSPSTSASSQQLISTPDPTPFYVQLMPQSSDNSQSTTSVTYVQEDPYDDNTIMTQNPPIYSAAISSKRSYEIKPLMIENQPAEPSVVNVDGSEQPVKVIFHTQSSPMMVRQIHTPRKPVEMERTNSVDEPTRVLHAVMRPVIQEVREIIQPYRRLTQEIRPVLEEIHTIVSKDGREMLSEPSQPPLPPTQGPQLNQQSGGGRGMAPANNNYRNMFNNRMMMMVDSSEPPLMGSSQPSTGSDNSGGSMIPPQPPSSSTYRSRAPSSIEPIQLSATTQPQIRYVRVGRNHPSHHQYHHPQQQLPLLPPQSPHSPLLSSTTPSTTSTSLMSNIMFNEPIIGPALPGPISSPSMMTSSSSLNYHQMKSPSLQIRPTLPSPVVAASPSPLLSTAASLFGTFPTSDLPLETFFGNLKLNRNRMKQSLKPSRL